MTNILNLPNLDILEVVEEPHQYQMKRMEFQTKHIEIRIAEKSRQ